MTSDALFSTVELGSPSRAGYRLVRLEVLNWGTFDGTVWGLALDGETTLVTGDIGSGKSTLVDALTTLLMPSHKIAYNKAAGAEAKERSLRSYVEGHYKSERNEANGKSRPRGLREDRRSYSVILGVFGNEGHGEVVTLAQVFQQREASGQPYRFFVTASRALSIATDFAGFGTDLRDLRKRLRAQGAEIFDEFPKYATATRRLLAIRSEQAMELFHQTVSMKAVGNLNDFVRDHMLEPSDASDRVHAIIAHFDDLTKAHDAVKRAREQLEALQPVHELATKYDATVGQRDALERQSSAVRLFIAELRAGMLVQELDQLRAEGARLLREQDEAKAQLRELAGERDALIEERARAGGDRIGELERLARDARAVAERRRNARFRFDESVAAAGLAAIGDRSGFAELTALVAGLRPRLDAEQASVNAASYDAIGRQKELQRQREIVERELSSLEQRTSNLPVEQVEVREQLCADLALTTQDLPYAGELIDILEEHSEWRGAAERVLRGFAVSLLVPQQHYDAVSEWVNSRRLTYRGRGGGAVGARLVYERVAGRRIRLQPPQHEGLRLADCLEIREGEFHDFVASELMQRADHTCAWDLEEFRTQRRAVTREGLVRAGERHEKDDRHRVDDPRRWVLGWANERKIAALRGEVADLHGQLLAAAAEVEALTGRRDALQEQLQALARLKDFDTWDDLDAAEALARAKGHDDERARLEAGSSRLAEITSALAGNADRAAAVGAEIEELTGRVATTAATARAAEQALHRDEEFIAAHPPQDLIAARTTYEALRIRLGTRAPAHAAACTEAEGTLSSDLHARVQRLTKELGGYGQSLGQAMGEVLRRWPELQADLDATVEARADFLAYRQRVANDDLPRFEAEFKEQLNKNAIQELAGFSNWLNRQAAAIDERIARINEALGSVPYNPGRIIRLEKGPTPNQEVAAFRADLRNLSTDSLALDGDQYSEQRFLDVQRIIMRFRGRDGYADADRQWTRRMTDVRNWFVFAASERDLETDEEWEHYSDSDGKSGGQKEKLAYTILAASLAYQFGLVWGAEQSRDFRFAVIDEAFGRGSDISTRYALELFAKLGLQLLIVTPLTKIRVIEPYVRTIGYVDNPTGTSSRLHTMSIEDYRQRREGRTA